MNLLARTALSVLDLFKHALQLLIKLALGLGAIGVLLFALGDGTLGDQALSARVTSLARDHLFDYVAWEVDALWHKSGQELYGVHAYLSETDRSALVVEYLDTLNDVQLLNAQIEQVYSNPAVSDPAVATTDQRAERDALRHQLRRDQGLVEAIIEEQVSAVLADEEFAVLGQVMPPVSMHFTAMPSLLVISPRDRIEFEASLNLDPLTVDERDALETAIETELDVAALIVPLGGLSLYPAMIVEPSYRTLDSKVARAIEVTAHEWSHHYLIFYPLGWEYESNPQTRIINETTATFFGREIARKVMARYYPDLIQPEYPSFLTEPDASPAPMNTTSAESPDPPPFDYAAEMNRTRVIVDMLLAKGRITLAEKIMEWQRQKFVRNGYQIRKINQAYFAFYGGYQGAPGIGGTDPTGPAIEELRVSSPSLHAWIETMRGITTRDELLAARDAARATTSP